MPGAVLSTLYTLVDSILKITLLVKILLVANYRNSN